MKPHLKNILFKPFEGSEITEGGLIVPESVRKLSNKGEIVEIGNKVTKVKKGDIGFKVKSDGSESWCMELIINGHIHFLLDEDAILALEN